MLAALLSLVILPTPEEPLPQPTDNLAIHNLEAQSVCCLQPFHTLDTRDRPFHTQAQEILDILLRHPSGMATLLRIWGGGFPSDQNGCRPRHLSPFLVSQTGWWLVENKDQQTAWFPAPYLEEVATGQGQESGLALQGSGMSLSLL